jgi:hypothetical protein
VVSGLYEERAARCTLPGGVEQDCKVFVAAPARRIAEGRLPPSARFVETLRKGARERGLSAAWIARLDQ